MEDCFNLAPIKREGQRCLPSYQVLSNFLSGDNDIDLNNLRTDINSMLDVLIPKKRMSLWQKFQAWRNN